MKGRKCSLIFMRKVAGRLNILEERYKDLGPRERAKKINEEMLATFCVGEREIRHWKNIIKVADSTEHMFRENIMPSHLREIARLPREEQQKEVMQEIQDKKLTVKQTSFLVDKLVAKPSPPMPQQSFDVIYADPPWRYEVDFLSASPNSHYLTRTLEEISNEDKPNTTEDAILFLWTTNPMLEEALKVVKAWGFTYKTNIVWVKDKIGLGFYVRGQHELLLIGVKGKVHPPEESSRISSVLNAPLREHSKKPSEVYEIIERLYPNSKRIELYATEKREGWISWGNEI